MAVNLYVDSTKADDTGDGLSWANAKKHISAALALLPVPIDDEYLVNLKGTTASPQSYIDDTDAQIVLSDLMMEPGASLKFYPEVWTQENYTGDSDPFNATPDAGTWDETAEKPVTLPRFTLNHCFNVYFYGCAFESNTSASAAFQAQGFSHVYLHYCSFSDGVIGVTAMNKSVIDLNNSHSYHNMIGVVSGADSLLHIIGQNLIIDNRRNGVVAWESSKIIFRYWADGAMRFVTKIRTTVPLLKYAAIRAMLRSHIDIMDEYFDDDDVQPAHVQILCEVAYRSPQYYGVQAESGSMVSGVENLSFADASVNDGKDTIDEENKIVLEKNDGAMVIE